MHEVPASTDVFAVYAISTGALGRSCWINMILWPRHVGGPPLHDVLTSKNKTWQALLANCGGKLTTELSGRWLVAFDSTAQ